MANNRPIFVEDASFDRSVARSFDEFQQGLPEEIAEELAGLHAEEKQAVPLTEEPDAVHCDRLEVTTQQLSRAVAGTVLIGFGIFLLGYLMGGTRIERSSELIPQELYTAFLKPAVASVIGQKVSSEYARFATIEEADTLRQELGNKGTSVEVVKRASYTASGREYAWYSVCDTVSHEDV